MRFPSCLWSCTSSAVQVSTWLKSNCASRAQRHPQSALVMLLGIGRTVSRARQVYPLSHEERLRVIGLRCPTRQLSSGNLFGCVVPGNEDMSPDRRHSLLEQLGHAVERRSIIVGKGGCLCLRHPPLCLWNHCCTASAVQGQHWRYQTGTAKMMTPTQMQAWTARFATTATNALRARLAPGWLDLREQLPAPPPTVLPSAPPPFEAPLAAWLRSDTTCRVAARRSSLRGGARRCIPRRKRRAR